MEDNRQEKESYWKITDRKKRAIEWIAAVFHREKRLRLVGGKENIISAAHCATKDSTGSLTGFFYNKEID